MVTANPKTAGVARWNFLALWGHKAGQGDAACLDFVTKVRDLCHLRSSHVLHGAVSRSAYSRRMCGLKLRQARRPAR